jgi:hypothetical protein
LDYIVAAHQVAPEKFSARLIQAQLTTVDREITGTARCIDILNRADPDLYQFTHCTEGGNQREGDIITTEAMREGVRKLEAYVEEISSNNAVNGPINVDKVHASVPKLWNVVQSQPGISEEQVRLRHQLPQH